MPDSQYDEVDLEAYRVARDTRNMEIALFWQRSNYFLVLSTATAAGFFSLEGMSFSVALAVFGLVVACLWTAVNLGSKFWQCRWEQRLHLTELRLRLGLDLFSASWETVLDDVRQSFKFRERGWVHRIYARL